MLIAKHIKKSFHQPTVCEVLKDINLQVKEGETVAIMGTSGVGKSTLLHILGTLEKPDSGDLIIADKVVRNNVDLLRNKEIGFVFQAFFLFDHLSVIDNVLMPAKIGRKKIHKGSPDYNNALALIESVGLSDRKDHLARNLSGGEKQRTCIARALINNPSLIFADEPTGNLDQKTSRQIQKVLLNQVKKQNTSLVLATHDPEFAKRCDRVYQLKNGQLIQIDLTFK